MPSIPSTNAGASTRSIRRRPPGRNSVTAADYSVRARCVVKSSHSAQVADHGPYGPLRPPPPRPRSCRTAGRTSVRYTAAATTATMLSRLKGPRTPLPPSGRATKPRAAAPARTMIHTGVVGGPRGGDVPEGVGADPRPYPAAPDDFPRLLLKLGDCLEAPYLLGQRRDE